MNILLVTYDFYPNTGGVAYSLLNICKNLRVKGHNLYVFNRFYKNKNIFKIVSKVKPNLKALFSSFIKKEFYLFTFKSFWALIRDKQTLFSHRINMILYLLLNPRKLIWTIDNLIHIYPYLKEIKFDIIFGGNTRWCLPLNFIISRFFKKRIITMAYGSDFLLGWPLSLKSSYYKNLDKIIVICNQMKQLIKNVHHLNEEQLEIIHIGINAEDLDVKESKIELRRESNIPLEQFVILGVGRHSSRKKFDLVIRAIYNIKKLRPALNIKCFLVGEGQNTKKLKQLTKKLKLKSEVDILGFCDFETRNKFYKLSDVFIMPSISSKNNIEGFGIVFLEANYHKIPVIGSASGGIIDAIVNNKTGLLIKPNSLKDLVDKILYLYDNEHNRIKIGENGYNRVINDFTWDKIIPDYIKVFEDLILKRKSLV